MELKNINQYHIERAFPLVVSMNKIDIAIKQILVGCRVVARTNCVHMMYEYSNKKKHPTAQCEIQQGDSFKLPSYCSAVGVMQDHRMLNTMYITMDSFLVQLQN